MLTKSVTALVTGASSGIGAVYADRLAKRGHPLVIVGRNQARLDELANGLRRDAGVAIEVLRADLTEQTDLGVVASRLEKDENIGLLINNAGWAAPGTFLTAKASDVEELIAINIGAVARLAMAPLQRFVSAGSGAIVNMASVVALAPEMQMGAYGPTKAFVLALSQALQAEVGSKGVYVQAVLPGATRTAIWERSGRDVNKLPNVMSVEALVDAAIVGFDRQEAITIPSLSDAAQWDALNAARRAMLPNLGNAHPAARYAS